MKASVKFKQYITAQTISIKDGISIYGNYFYNGCY